MTSSRSSPSFLSPAAEMPGPVSRPEPEAQRKPWQWRFGDPGQELADLPPASADLLLTAPALEALRTLAAVRRWAAALGAARLALKPG